jgi:hypothetical protein
VVGGGGLPFVFSPFPLSVTPPLKVFVDERLLARCQKDVGNRLVRCWLNKQEVS